MAGHLGEDDMNSMQMDFPLPCFRYLASPFPGQARPGRLASGSAVREAVL
jgi:hypothetical protein